MNDTPGLITKAPQVLAALVFNGDGGVVRVGSTFNIGSIVRTATGVFTVTFIDQMPDTLYLPICSCGGATGFTYAGMRMPFTFKTRKGFDFATVGTNGANSDPHDVQIVVWG